MRRRIFSLLFAGALALSLAGCHSDKPVTHPTTPPAPENTPGVTTPASVQPPPTSSAPPEVTPSPTPAPEPSDKPVDAPADLGWNDREAEVTFGMASGADCPLVVSGAGTGEDSLTVSLLPAGNEGAFTAYLEAENRLPHTEITYDPDAGALLLRLENTTLSSGEVTGDDWVFDFIAEHGMTYPASTPMGSVGEDTRYFEKAAISTVGDDTMISLLLTDAAAEYRVETGSEDGAGMRPYFRLVFQELG